MLHFFRAADTQQGQPVMQNLPDGADQHQAGMAKGLARDQELLRIIITVELTGQILKIIRNQMG